MCLRYEKLPQNSKTPRKIRHRNLLYSLYSSERYVLLKNMTKGTCSKEPKWLGNENWVAGLFIHTIYFVIHEQAFVIFKHRNKSFLFGASSRGEVSKAAWREAKLWREDVRSTVWPHCFPTIHQTKFLNCANWNYSENSAEINWKTGRTAKSKTEKQRVKH